MHAFGTSASRSALGALLVAGLPLLAAADEHMVFDLDATKVYDVIADGTILHGNLQPGTWGYLVFDAPAGAQLEVVASGEGGSGSGGGDGDTTPPAVIEDLALVRSTPGSVSLGWTATGDDGTTGQAVAYELRYARTPVDERSFDAATLMSLPPPRAAGSEEGYDILGLEPGTRYYVAIRAQDEAGNVSLLAPSLLVETRGADDMPIPPSNPRGIAANGSVELDWDPSLDPAVVGYHIYRLRDGEQLEAQLTASPLPQMSYTDDDVDEGHGYTYRLTGIDASSNESTTAASTWVRALSLVPAAPAIEKMYPNPVRGTEPVIFRLGIPEVGPGHPNGRRVTVDLYDVAGRRVARVFDDFVLPGVREVSWQPRATGRAFVPGLYVTVLNAGGAPVTGRLAIAR